MCRNRGEEISRENNIIQRLIWESLTVHYRLRVILVISLKDQYITSITIQDMNKYTVIS
jgi:hypothetical protein